MSPVTFSCVLLATLTLTLVGRAADEPRVLTRVADIRALSREEAAKKLPVRLRGVVIWQNASPEPSLFIHDGEQSIYVDTYRAIAKHIWLGGKLSRDDCSPRALIELEGITDPGGYAPCVFPIRFHRIGTAPLPEARRSTLTALQSGIEDGQRVEVKGVIQELSSPDPTGRSYGVLMLGGYPCQVVIENGKGLDAGRLVDASVRVRGCSSPIFNLRSEAINIRLKVQNAADIDIDRPAPADPFAATRVPLQRLLQFTLKPESFHRKVTQGTVNFALPGRFFFLQDGTTGVRVESPTTSVQPGDRVEVAAFIDTSQTLASLKNALVRKLGRETQPPPQPVTAEQILHSSQSDFWHHRHAGDFSGRLVRISGTLQKFERGAAGAVRTLLIRSGDEFFQAHLLHAAGSADPVWKEGSQLELAGVCELNFDTADISRRISPAAPMKDLPEIGGFNLWLRSPDDVRVLSVPSWWTPLRLGIALVGALLVLVLALAWVGLLRRQVRRQLDIIGDKHRVEAVDAERNRMARDLHDSLEQHLAGVALHLDGAARNIQHGDTPAAEAITLARQMLRHTRTEARRSVWDLRSEVLEREGLAAALFALAKSSEVPLGQMKVETEITGQPFPLPEGADFHLLRIAQEALANILKHARATRVLIRLEYQPQAVTLSVQDDGQGFDPAASPGMRGAHFGLQGMRERAIRSGAELTIAAAPGNGCCITVILPCAPQSRLKLTASD